MLFSLETAKFDITPMESRILLLTSSFTIFPIIMAFSYGLVFYGLTTIGTGVCSIIYWIYPIHGWRRDLDLLYAKYSFVVYFSSGIYYIPLGLPTFIFYCGAILLVYNYFLTYFYPKDWIIYHVRFHILSILMKLYIVFYINLYSVYDASRCITT